MLSVQLPAEDEPAGRASHSPAVRGVLLTAPEDGVVSRRLRGDGHDTATATVGRLWTRHGHVTGMHPPWPRWTRTPTHPGDRAELGGVVLSVTLAGPHLFLGTQGRGGRGGAPCPRAVHRGRQRRGWLLGDGVTWNPP